MSEKWQINRVSTSERIFDKINTEVDRPFGIIVYGADCDYKFKTVDKFLKQPYGRCLYKLPEHDGGFLSGREVTG